MPEHQDKNHSIKHRCKNVIIVQWVINSKIFLLCGHLHPIHPHKSGAFLFQLQHTLSFRADNSFYLYLCLQIMHEGSTQQAVSLLGSIQTNIVPSTMNPEQRFFYQGARNNTNKLFFSPWLDIYSSHTSLLAGL